LIQHKVRQHSDRQVELHASAGPAKAVQLKGQADSHAQAEVTVQLSPMQIPGTMAESIPLPRTPALLKPFGLPSSAAASQQAGPAVNSQSFTSSTEIDMDVHIAPQAHRVVQQVQRREPVDTSDEASTADQQQGIPGASTRYVHDLCGAVFRPLQLLLKRSHVTLHSCSSVIEL